ncbi:phage portal protein [Aliarcobacter butzleri]|uniref:phage portal protein n=1 Tax=Aliarcobacter butzleri TaxID=28197 RepID=UPI003AFA7D2E
MRIFGFEIKRAGEQKTAKRSFNAANTGNLYSNWIPSNTTADIDIKRDLKTIRARSRELMRNDDYAKKFKRMVKSNVVGNQGIRLQNKAKDINGNLDKVANDLIEEAFKKWSKKGICDTTKKYSLKEIQKMVMGTLAEDGEVLVRKIKGYNNEFGFAVQLLEADHLDEQFNDPERNIFMGIEYDRGDAPIAYHLYKTHPGRYGSLDLTRERVPANEIIHLFIPLRISATRGVPWMHTAMTRMKMVNGYEEAELTASRIAAAKGGFYVQKDGAEEYEGDTTDDQGRLVNELEPGQFEILQKGYDFKNYDPQHPNAAFKDFMKVVLRGISSGLDVSYNTLANDLESVNFSSLRGGTLEEREVWKELMTWLGENLMDDLFADWLDMALLKKALPLPYFKYDKFNSPSWLYRGFSWVDPLKDIQSNILANKEGLKTHSEIASEMGKDLEELYQQLAKEKELRAKYGITTISDAELLQLMATTLTNEVQQQ